MNLDIDDEDSRFLLHSHSTKWGNKIYEMRPMYSLDSFGILQFKNVQLLIDHDVITSIPLFAKVQGASVSELEYERMQVRVKSEYNNKDFHN